MRNYISSFRVAVSPYIVATDDAVVSRGCVSAKKDESYYYDNVTFTTQATRSVHIKVEIVHVNCLCVSYS